jgi:hypothetical protein
MFIEVVHINGIYSPASNSHQPPRNMSPGYYNRLSGLLQRESSGGATIVYQPNLYSITDKDPGHRDMLSRALDSDPFLHAAQGLTDLIVQPAYERSPDISGSDYMVKYRLIRESGVGIFVGAYTTECVATIAFDSQKANPASQIYVDYMHSIDRGAPYTDPAHRYIPHRMVGELH